MAKTSGLVEVSSLHRPEVFVSHRNVRLPVHGRADTGFADGEDTTCSRPCT
ncbi:hypothetical protein [Streptomyces albicerus]|uniref:hypothetical protein n=1 Tax=Streptomyces albicerus TaxID=2569859 RepID=UPI001788D650|nr:hypothetical protein [Streptomyces albicerus]